MAVTTIEAGKRSKALSLRPTRVSSGETKIDKSTKDYHLKQATYIYDAYTKGAMFSNFLNSIVRWHFYNNNQWILQEDNETFLKDETNDFRNRVKFTMNIIKPIVKHFRGNSIRTDFSYTLVNISKKSANRRERKLKSLKAITGIAQQFPEFKEDLKKKYPIGDDVMETEEKFERFYTDEIKEGMNIFMQNVIERNKFEELKNKDTLSMAIDGIGINKWEERNGHMKWRRLFLKNYIFDTSATEPDHSDADFQGEWYYMSKSEILERFGHKLEKDTIDYLNSIDFEDFSLNDMMEEDTSYFKVMGANGKLPVYELYWDDVEECEYGCVLDEFGYEILTEINNSERTKYTTADVVPPTTEFHKRYLNGGLTIRTYPTCVRFCIFIPAIAIPKMKQGIGLEKQDIVLDYGAMPYQDLTVQNEGNQKPYKVYCINYSDGIIYSLVDDLISPQRIVNRFLSMGEAAMNNWRNGGTIVDEDAIDGTHETKIEMQRDMNLGKTIFVRANGQMNNVIGHYNSDKGETTNVMFNMASVLQGMINNNQGVNESMTGTGGGYRVSVGAVMSNINQGNIQQEDFYFAMNMLLQQCYEAIANQGKRLYVENQTELARIVGDKYAHTFTLTKEYLNEEFRLFVKRSSSYSEQIAAGNDRLLLFKQLGLIDDQTFAEMYNNSTIDDIQKGLRDYQLALIEAQKKVKEIQDQQRVDATEYALATDAANQLDADIQRKDALSMEAEKNDIELMKAASKNNLQ